MENIKYLFLDEHNLLQKKNMQIALKSDVIKKVKENVLVNYISFLQ